jgi:hypothetical protein
MFRMSRPMASVTRARARATDSSPRSSTSAVRAVRVAALVVWCGVAAPLHAYTDAPITVVVRPFLDIDTPFTLCGEERLFTWNASFVHQTIVDEIRARARERSTTPLDVLMTHGEGTLTGTDLERCRWNKTRFLIQVTYFGIHEDALADGAVVDDRAIADIFRVRNALFDRWWEASRAEDIVRAPSDFYEWEGERTEGMPLDTFLAKESRILPWMSALGRRFVTPPAYGVDDDTRAAESALHHLLRMRTPLSSLAPVSALFHAEREGVREAMACLAESVREPACSVNLWRSASSCAAAQGLPAHGDVLTLLGLFSSQEAFLLRDLRVWIDENLPRERATHVLSVFADGARVYYRAQALAHACGPDALYPEEDTLRRRRDRSTKAYHSYAMAWSAYRLRAQGFSDDDARTVPPTVGRSYKEKAFVLGAVYNFVVGIPLERGATADVGPVTDAQTRGARLGSLLFDADMRRGHATSAVVITTVDEPLALLPRVVDYRYAVDDGRTLEVTVADGPFRRERVVRVPLTDDQQRELRRRGHALPRVRVTRTGLTVEG